MKTLVINVKNSLEENIGLINISINNYIKTMKHSSCKTYLRYCFKQAVEYAILQEHCSLETISLIQFYSLLNLVKSYIIVKQNITDTTLVTLEKSFSSHGASSKNKNDVVIKQKGVFLEFSKIINSNTEDKKQFSLIDLYKKIPDLYEYLPLIFHSEYTDYKKVVYWQQYMYESGNMNSTLDFHWLVIDKSDFKKVNQNSCFIKQEEIKDKIIFSKKNKNDSFSDILKFDCDGNLFIRSKDDSFNELSAIYLIFLKYSSLVRYKPKTWNEKTNSNELLIIEKMTHTLFKKFWGYIAKEIRETDYILV